MRNRRARIVAKAAEHDLRPVLLFAGTALATAALAGGWLSAVLAGY